MKLKPTLAALLVLTTLTMIGCSSAEDETVIGDRINSLEESINSQNFSDFLSCFDEDCDYYSSYTQSQFNILTASGSYSFDKRNYDISDENATVTCTATIAGITTAATVFKLKKRDKSWYILLWTEDGSEMFRQMKIN